MIIIIIIIIIPTARKGIMTGKRKKACRNIDSKVN
jgi:hypothetical protein